MEPPHGQLCWRAHKKSVVSIDLAEDKALIVTASTDCCVCLWTMEGRYIGKQCWVSVDLQNTVKYSTVKPSYIEKRLQIFVTNLIT